MINHIILWKIKDEYSASEKKTISENVKAGLEGLVGVIPGLLSASVSFTNLPGSTADLMFVSVFETEADLIAYRKDARHNAVADKYVRPFMSQRLCYDHVVTD